MSDGSGVDQTDPDSDGLGSVDKSMLHGKPRSYSKPLGYGNLQRKHGGYLPTLPPLYNNGAKNYRTYADYKFPSESDPYSLRQELRNYYKNEQETAIPSWYRHKEPTNRWSGMGYGDSYNYPRLNDFDQDRYGNDYPSADREYDPPGAQPMPETEHAVGSREKDVIPSPSPGNSNVVPL